MKFRASQIGKLMTPARKKSEILSKTAQSYIRHIAKQDFYGYVSQVSKKAIRKGIKQEQKSIDLLNEFRFQKYEKNTVRLSNDFVTGEPDIITENSIIDIKTSWSLETFPATPDEIDSSLYEWQLITYMWLFKKSSAELIYCMIDTDDDLLNEWDNLTIHKVSQHPPAKRITSLNFERQPLYEEQMEERLFYCSEYYDKYMNELINK
jgi:hypothetical protein